MTVKLGINPLTWTNDDLPELGGDTPLETCLSEGAQAGFTGFELGYKFPRDPAVLGPILESHKLSIVSGWYSSELLTRTAEEEIEALQDHLHLLKTLGANVMVFCEVTDCIHGQMETSLQNKPEMTDAQWELFLSRVNVVAKYLAEQGVRIAYHHHMGTVIQTEAEVDRLMAGTDDALGLLLDTGHLTYAGGDPLAVQQRHAARINHVHCKDIRAEVVEKVRREDLSFLQGVLAGTFTVPGDGCIEYLALFRQLKASGYQGWLVVEAEQDPAVAHPLTYARLGHDNLQQLCADAGLIVAT